MNHRYSIALSCLFLLAAGQATANDAFVHVINSANELLRNGDYAEAIERYDTAETLAGNRDLLSYNKAIALYREGKIDAANELFGQVATSLNTEIASKASYNAGNCDFSNGNSKLQDSPGAAIEFLQSAINRYRRTLRLSPTDQDARANLELAAKLLHQARQQQNSKQQQESENQNQPDSQQDQGDQDKSQDQHDKSDGQQDSDATKQQESDSGQSQSEQDGRSDEESGSEQENDQPSSDEQESPENSETQETQPTDQQPDSEGEQAGSEDEQAESEGDQSGSEGELSTDNDSGSESERTEGSFAADSTEEFDGQMTEQEARKMLQAIRDRDFLRRLRRQAAERSRHIPVERDW